MSTLKWIRVLAVTAISSPIVVCMAAAITLSTR